MLNDSHWNYRVLRLSKGWYGISEVYYERGKPTMRTEPFVTGESVKDIQVQLKMMLKDSKRKVLDDKLFVGEKSTKLGSDLVVLPKKK